MITNGPPMWENSVKDCIQNNEKQDYTVAQVINGDLLAQDGHWLDQMGDREQLTLHGVFDDEGSREITPKLSRTSFPSWNVEKAYDLLLYMKERQKGKTISFSFGDLSVVEGFMFQRFCIVEGARSVKS